VSDQVEHARDQRELIPAGEKPTDLAFPPPAPSAHPDAPFGAVRLGMIDRSIQDVSSRPDMLCTFVTLDS
jgi:hypothetical protein